MNINIGLESLKEMSVGDILELERKIKEINVEEQE